MDTKNIVKSLIVSAFFIFLVLITGRVYSESLEVSGNASGSNNSININQTESNTVNQSNSSNANNSVNTNSNTGGNSVENGVGGGSVTTGNATSNVNVNNQFNNNIVDINCKNCPTPTHQLVGPTSTPTPRPSGKGVSVRRDGGDGGRVEAGANHAPAVLGLAATSGDKSLFQIIPGFLSIQTNNLVKEPIMADRAFKKVSKESDVRNIIVPRFNINLPVIRSKIKNGYWEVSETSASHGEGSANPGEAGNVVVFAHAREGLFLKLRDMKKDDAVYILTNDRWYKYRVSEIVAVSPNDVTTVAPTDSEILTLFTCSGFFDEKRLIVKAIPEE